MNAASPTTCPPQDQLAQLVTGSLMESEAERLFEHLDECPSCQETVDKLSVRSDHVLEAVRRADQESSDSEDIGLSRLISFAQRLPRSDETQTARKSTTQAVSAGDFVNGLRRSGLMAPDDIEQLLSDLNWEDTSANRDGSTIAKAFIENRKLTPFQAKLLLRGRWKGLVLGNYAILERLGQGGMGSVFKARHLRMGRIVCLKVVNSAGRQSQSVIDRFRNEARALAALSHPNIVVAHDADESKGVPYLVMEFIDGDDLAKYVRSHDRMSPKDVLEVATQTAEALQYAHSQGVIHRDVKPHNIVATRNTKSGAWSVKVLDLGLARFDSLITDNPDASVLAAMTNTGVVIGTVDYMSPEQALDSRNADARSDVYSLGCTIFFLLTGHAPFPGETVMQRLVAHREEPAPELWQIAGVSVDIEAVVHKMLAKCPEDRYQSMEEVLRELRLLKEGKIPLAASETTAPGEVAPAGTGTAQPISAAPAAAPLPPPSYVDPPATVTNPVAAEDVLAESALDAPEPIAAVASEATATITLDSSPLDMEFDVPDAAPPKPRRRRERGKLIAGNGATALALLLISAAAVMAAPIWSWVMPRYGGDRAIRNGGEGRALVIVGSENFPEDQFKALTGQLQSQQIDVVAASAQYGTGKKEFGAQLKAPFSNINLARAKATDFDAIFVLSGSCGELLHKDKTAKQSMARIVENALRHDVVLTGCSDGWKVIHEIGVTHKPDYKDKPKFKTHNADELAAKADYIFGQMLVKK